MWAVVEIGASQVNSMQECQSDHSCYNNHLTLWGHFSKYKIGLIDTLTGSHTEWMPARVSIWPILIFLFFSAIECLYNSLFDD